jgi:non-ribosomal peptide synthase protein (TIGR01720 family)
MMTFGEQQPPQLFIAIHHLVFDRVSLSLFMDDLNTVYEQLSQGRGMSLPAKTASFRQWATRLLTYSESDLQRERTYWENLPWETGRLPRDYANGRNTLASTARFTARLEQADTRRLYELVVQEGLGSIRDVLLAAAAGAVSEWTGQRTFFVSLATHGREPLFPDIDITRTIGWLACTCPVLLELPDDTNRVAAVRTVTRCIKSVPNQGIGFGLLRYRCRVPALIEHPEPEFHFNYLGDVSDWQAGRSFEVRGPSRHPPTPGELRGGVLDVDVHVEAGRIVMTWIYSTELHAPQTISRLAQATIGWLRALVS